MTNIPILFDDEYSGDSQAHTHACAMKGNVKGGKNKRIAVSVGWPRERHFMGVEEARTRVSLSGFLKEEIPNKSMSQGQGRYVHGGLLCKEERVYKAERNRR